MPDVDSADTMGFTYNSCYHTGKITAHEIQAAIIGSISKKAPGEDGILNLILKLLVQQLLPHLYRISNNSLSLGYCCHGKSNYTILKAYRPIALLNTLGKAFEFILAKRITYIAETYGLLPSNYLSARRASSTEHALHYMTERIYSAWNTKKIASALLLDVTGAFDNVSKDRLLHNLRQKKSTTE